VGNRGFVVDLWQLSDPDLFTTVSAGLRFLLANALNLHREAAFAGRAGHGQSGVILSGFAQEEAAKFHILLDAIRCPRGSVFDNHLKRHFYSHLARGIYAEHYDSFPADFGDVRFCSVKIGDLRRVREDAEAPWIAREVGDPH
jgi:AbiV family abortive infection protein